jgi:hypothetical protein
LKPILKIIFFTGVAVIMFGLLHLFYGVWQNFEEQSLKLNPEAWDICTGKGNEHMDCDPRGWRNVIARGIFLSSIGLVLSITSAQKIDLFERIKKIIFKYTE